MIGLNRGIEVEGANFMQIGGDWGLKDLQGKPFSSDKLAGSYYVLFFGSTLCPDICPLTLMKIMKAKRRHERNSEGKTYLKFKAVFVDVNPEKDSAK